MLFTAADILNLEPVKVFEQKLGESAIVCDIIQREAGILLNQKDVCINDGSVVKITTSGARKMVIVLHKDSIQAELSLRNLILRL